MFTDKQNQIATIRAPVRNAILNQVKAIKDLCARKSDAQPEQFSIHLRTESVTLTRLKAQLSSLDNKWINEMDHNLPVEEFEKEYTIMNGFGRRIDEGQALIDAEIEIAQPDMQKQLLEGVTTMLNQTRTQLNQSVANVNESQLEDVLTRLAVVQEQQSHHLPVLDIKKFDGDITTFYSWWDEFRVNIHDRAHIPNSQKFTYLRNLLEGEAAKSIESTPSTGANYVKTLNYLFVRYGNVETIAIEIFTPVDRNPKDKQNL